MFMPIIMWEMCRASSAVLHQLAYIDVMRVLLVQLSAPMPNLCVYATIRTAQTHLYICHSGPTNYQAILQ